MRDVVLEKHAPSTSTVNAARIGTHLQSIVLGFVWLPSFGLKSKNSFMILTVTCLVAIELVMEFIWNFMVFHLMSNHKTYWVPYHFCGFAKIK
jgi:hypothetical protein